MKPTLEEVKEFFKNAKVVKCLAIMDNVDLTEIKITRDIHDWCGQYWLDYTGDIKRNLKLWCEGEYAEIVEYKQQETMNKELIDKLSKGEIAVINDGSRAKLREILKKAFPNDPYVTSANYTFYFRDEDKKTEYYLGNSTALPAVSVKDFFKTEESKEDKLDRLQKELEELRQSIKKEKVLFITESGKEIKEGDTYWCVNTAPHLMSVFEQTAKENTMLNKGVKAFNTSEEAVEYRDSLIKLPIINGYQGEEKLGDCIKYGCAYIPKAWFTESNNRHIKSLVLSSGVEINEEQMNQIRKFLKKN